VSALRGISLRDASVLAFALLCLIALALINQPRDAAHPVTYSTYDASGGGYRAWYELLSREGVAVSRFEERAAFLDRSTRTVVVSDPPPHAFRGDVARTDAAALAAWVKSGGRLVVVGDGAVVSLLRTDLKLRRTTEEPSHSASRVSAELRAAGVRTVAAFATARLVPRLRDAILVSDRRGALVVRYPYGRGVVVDAIDGEAFSNERVATPDNARLAVALVGTGGPVAFDEAVHGYLTPEHWWTVLPRRFVLALLAACAALAIALVGAAVRLGPPLVLGDQRSATSAEYVDALAALYERAGAASKALRDAFRSTKRVVAGSLGLPDDAPLREFAARIERADLRSAFADLEALATYEAPHHANLVRGLALAHELRREFGSHDRRR
jgi:uncharacterized protein DUF4350